MGMEWLETATAAWGQTVIWFGSLWAITLFIRKVSKDADADLDPEKKMILANRLSGLDQESFSSWVPDFTLVFDRFFGSKHFAWRCFYRSTLISVITFISLNFIFGRFDQISDTLEVLIAAFILNAIIDYISLLETRALLSRQIHISLKLILDAIFTFILSSIWFAVVFHVAINIGDGMMVVLERASDIFKLIKEFWLLLPSKDHFLDFDVLARAVLLTGFTTSIWLWLHGLAQVSIRGLSSIPIIMSWLNVREAPLRAIGTTINIIVLFLGALMFPVFLAI